MKAGIIAALAAGLLLALPAAPALAINASDVAPCRPGLPQQLRTLKGLFTVHVVCDHVLYEIPLAMLDRDMLLNTEFAALSAGTEKLAPGAVVENRLVRWTRRGNKVYLEAVTYEMRAPNMPSLQRGVEAASLRPVIKAFEAIAEGENGAPVIDVTGLYVTDVPEGFAQEFKTYFQMTAMDPKRSYIETVKVFPRNVEMRYFQTWMADPRALARSYEPGRSPIPASLGFVFHTSMLLLPDRPMVGRYSDPRVGYFDLSFDDYGTPEHRAVRRGFITRYRLEKKHPELAVSEPIQPDRLLYQPRGAGQVASLDQEGHRSVAGAVRAGRLQERDPGPRRAEQGGRPRLGPGGRALLGDPLDAEPARERHGPGGHRSAQRRGHLLARPVLERRAAAGRRPGTSLR